MYSLPTIHDQLLDLYQDKSMTDKQHQHIADLLDQLEGLNTGERINSTLKKSVIRNIQKQWSLSCCDTGSNRRLLG